MKLLSLPNRPDSTPNRDVEEPPILATDDLLFPCDYVFELEVKMFNSGDAIWFWAFLDQKMVGDLTATIEDTTAWFYDIRLHPDFHHRGIRQTLVYEAGKTALGRLGATQLMIEEASTPRTAKIYESLGFRLTAKSSDLSLMR